tara:strand:+ start:12071 stop:12559 length:489 start_codon:yes stop_codon:yes gene_type:complete
MTEMNNKVENALKDKNIVNIMNKASGRFSRQIDQDEIYSCQLKALWRALVNFKPEKGIKFTTYLYNGVFIECLKEVQFHEKHRRFTSNILHENVCTKRDLSQEMIDVMDELRNDQEVELIMDKYSNMSIKEIASKHNINRETVRKKIKNIMARIRKRAEEVY